MTDPKKSEFKIGDKVQHRDGRGPLLVEAVKKGDGTKFPEGDWVYSVVTEDRKNSFDAAESDLSAAKGTEDRPLRSGGKLFKLDENSNLVEIESVAKPSSIKTHVPTPKATEHTLGGIEEHTAPTTRRGR